MAREEEKYYKAKKDYRERINAFYDLVQPDLKNSAGICYNLIHENWLGMFADIYTTIVTLDENLIEGSFSELAWHYCVQGQLREIIKDTKESIDLCIKAQRDIKYQESNIDNLKDICDIDLEQYKEAEERRKKLAENAIQDLSYREQLFDAICDSLYGLQFFVPIKENSLKESLAESYDQYKQDYFSDVDRELKDYNRENPSINYGIESLEWVKLYEYEIDVLTAISINKNKCGEHLELGYTEENDNYSQVTKVILKAESAEELFDMQYAVRQGFIDDFVNEAFYDDQIFDNGSIDELVEFLYSRALRLDVIRGHIYPDLIVNETSPKHFPACIGYDNGVSLYKNLIKGVFIPEDTPAADFLYLMGCTNEKPQNLQPIKWIACEAPKQLLRVFIMTAFKTETDNGSISKADLERIVPCVFVDNDGESITLAKNKEVNSFKQDEILGYLDFLSDI